MPFLRTMLTQLVERARDDFNARLPGADSRLRRSPLDVLARTHSGAVDGLYGLLAWLARQIMPDTADAEQLARWAAIWRVARKPAVAAAGTVNFSGTNGSAIPLGTLLQRADGVEFATSAAGVVAGGVAGVAIVAVEPGVAGNAAAGQRLTLVSPVAGVQAVAIVAAGGLAAGADEEDDDGLRARLLDRIQQPPMGGSTHDYLEWALEVPGVTRAWVYPGYLGPGSVGLTFVCDGRDVIIPTGDDIDVVQAFVDAVRPVTAALTVFAPVPMPVDLVIRATPPSAAVQAAIAAELADLFAREGEPGGTMLISHIDEAISVAAGEIDHAVIAPLGNVIAGAGRLPMVGAISWVVA